MAADDQRIRNAMTVDVEDYFQVSAFEPHVSQLSWGSFESRVVGNTERLLRVFDDLGVSATFFILGWVAERFPALVRDIADAGHEIASHGYAHRLVYTQTRGEFRDDIRRAAAALESAANVRVAGYRAPSFSIVTRSLWALDVLIDEGYTYDASIYPIRHDRYGIPGWSRHLQLVDRERGRLWELPGATVRVAGANLPIGGGGYFRLLPYACTQRGIARVNRRERQPVVFYLHPWEVDPDQPRIHAAPVASFRHYTNLGKTEARLRRLLSEFRFGTIADLLAAATAALPPAARSESSLAAT